MDTISCFDKIMQESLMIFSAKLEDYGPSWLVFRQTSLTDQILIKAKRISVIEGLNGDQKISDTVDEEYIGIINYALIALMKIRYREKFEKMDIFNEQISDYSEFYRMRTSIIEQIRELLEKKNHDYGEAWRDMRITSITDQILVKIYRIRTIEQNNGFLQISEDVDSHFSDIINYCVFALIKLQMSYGGSNE